MRRHPAAATRGPSLADRPRWLYPPDPCPPGPKPRCPVCGGPCAFHPEAPWLAVSCRTLSVADPLPEALDAKDEQRVAKAVLRAMGAS
jgi:hypothetical protein